MQKHTITDGENSIIVYSDMAIQSCIQCGQKLLKGWTRSYYLFFYHPDDKNIHPIHPDPGVSNPRLDLLKSDNDEPIQSDSHKPTQKYQSRKHKKAANGKKSLHKFQSRDDRDRDS